MTPIADMIEQMAAGGVPMDLILVAVRAAEISRGNSTGIPVDTAAEKRRAYDRERKRTKRNSPGNSTGIPPEVGGKMNKGHKLPEGWVPLPKHYDEGNEYGFDRAAVEAMGWPRHAACAPGRRALPARVGATHARRSSDGEPAGIMPRRA